LKHTTRPSKVVGEVINTKTWCYYIVIVMIYCTPKKLSGGRKKDNLSAVEKTKEFGIKPDCMVRLSPYPGSRNTIVVGKRE